MGSEEKESEISNKKDWFKFISIYKIKLISVVKQLSYLYEDDLWVDVQDQQGNEGWQDRSHDEAHLQP